MRPGQVGSRLPKKPSHAYALDVVLGSRFNPAPKIVAVAIMPQIDFLLISHLKYG
jgi:hypothetical protein